MNYGIRVNIYSFLLVARAPTVLLSKSIHIGVSGCQAYDSNCVHSGINFKRNAHVVRIFMCGNLCQLKDSGPFDLLLHPDNSLTSQSNTNRNEPFNEMNMSPLLFIFSSLCTTSLISFYKGYANSKHCNA